MTKRTVSVRDAEDDGPVVDGAEHKRAKEEGSDEQVLELTADDFECVICCGKSDHAGTMQACSVV